MEKKTEKCACGKRAQVRVGRTAVCADHVVPEMEKRDRASIRPIKGAPEGQAIMTKMILGMTGR
jgi:hypothetical protein